MIWRDMVVFACGAIAASFRTHQAAMRSMFCWSADSRTAMVGRRLRSNSIEVPTRVSPSVFASMPSIRLAHRQSVNGTWGTRELPSLTASAVLR